MSAVVVERIPHDKRISWDSESIPRVSPGLGRTGKGNVILQETRSGKAPSGLWRELGGGRTCLETRLGKGV